ncbi:MAG: hypothetical protein V7608_1589, partial [Hyphomicrobiales bacterium]
QDLALRLVIFGGEALNFTELRPRFERHGDTQPQLVNMYGITETTVHVTYRPVQLSDVDSATSAIGRPIPDLQAHVLDRHLEPLPGGVAGELYIGGAGLARGYLGRPGLTAERFVPDPFVPGARLYRTGDLARWRPDETLDYLGRGDHQVKIRGFRIELGEIEAALLAHAGIEQAAVIARQDATGKRLIAYVAGGAQAPLEIGELRRHLQLTLPDYMVPAAFVPLDALPLTPNGKLDRNALPAPEWHSEADYVPPRNPVETVLAGLFAQLLGLERVGINDNFFELGGDSIQSIQLVARARAKGVAITPQQIFQYQTVAALAAAADQTQASVEEDTEPGPSPLTPIQHWFFEQPGPIEHFNQAVLLEVPADIKPEHLEPATASILIHHDALRSRFDRCATGWQQNYLSADEMQIAFTHFDLAELAPKARVEQLEIAAAALQGSLDPMAGRMVAAGWFDFGAETPGRLLLVIHHLVVDGVSWRILLEDLVTAYGQLERGEAVKLPAKTTSFKTWARRLANRAHDAAASNELDLWSAMGRDAPPLPFDRAVDPQGSTYGQTDGLTIALPASETQALLSVVPQAYHSRINDALLAALSVALADWRAARGEAGTAALIDLEGHGREDLFAGADLSRTVGWFTTMFPVRLDAGALDVEQIAAGGPAAGIALKRIKEQLRRVPHNGIGWGLLRYLNAETADVLRRLPRASIAFNYLGRFDETGDKGWRLAVESSGPAIAPNRGGNHLLEIVALVAKDGALQTEWRWWPAAHDRASIEDLAQRFIHSLRGIIRHCTAAGVGGYTPSDFPLVRLDEAGLEDLARRYPDLDDVWPLAPMQHLILLHARKAPDSVAYHEQLCLTLDGELDMPAFEAAWRDLAARHAALRAVVVDDIAAAPPRAAPLESAALQVVRRDGQLPLRIADWSALDADVAKRQLRQLLAADKARGFDLADGPLLRASLLRHSLVRHTMILSFHHILLDGWSIPILLRELLELYRARRQRQRSSLPPSRPYRDYLAWLAAADQVTAKRFWRNRLAGFTAPCRLALVAGDSAASPDALGEHRVTLSEQLSGELQSLAQARRLTLNAVMQGAWALLLGRHMSRDDVMFGMTTAGRPGELAGIERMVGL